MPAITNTKTLYAGDFLVIKSQRQDEESHKKGDKKPASDAWKTAAKAKKPKLNSSKHTIVV